MLLPAELHTERIRPNQDSSHVSNNTIQQSGATKEIKQENHTHTKKYKDITHFPFRFSADKAAFHRETAGAATR